MFVLVSQMPVNSANDHPKLSIYLNMVDCRDSEENDWQGHDHKFGALHARTPSICVHFVFGFHEREEMVEFADALPMRMPMVSRFATVHYALKGNDRMWYQASLDSAELQGTLVDLLPCTMPADAMIRRAQG